MKLLVIVNHHPYDGTDVVFNALRLVSQSQSAGMTVNVFLLGDGVYLGQQAAGLGAPIDLEAMVAELLTRKTPVRLCKTCMERRKIAATEVREGVAVATMPELVELIAQADRVVNF